MPLLYVFPARVYRPKDKALVEGTVKIIYTGIFTKIDEKIYSSLEMLDEDILLYLQAHNSTLLTGCDYKFKMSKLRDLLETLLLIVAMAVS